MKADYLDDFAQLQDFLSKTDAQTIAVIFTAGDLDYQLRKWLQLC